MIKRNSWFWYYPVIGNLAFITARSGRIMSSRMKTSLLDQKETGSSEPSFLLGLVLGASVRPPSPAIARILVSSLSENLPILDICSSSSSPTLVGYKFPSDSTIFEVEPQLPPLWLITIILNKSLSYPFKKVSIIVFL